MDIRLVLALLACVPACLGYGGYRDRIPNGDRIPHPCKPNFIWKGVGHQNMDGGGARNPFGLDFARFGHSWSSELCKADSDGDGRTNGQELGDPNCVWQQGSTPQVSKGVSHPGVCEPMDSEACMEKNAWVDCEGPAEFECPHIHDPDVFNITIKFPRTKVPAKETTYICFGFELPDDREYHLIATRALIDNHNVMHHMGLAGCGDDVELPSEPVECDMGFPGCGEESLSIWTLGMAGECFNPNTGFLVGKGNTRKVSMQHHWTNPSLVDTYYDETGLMLYLTPRLRQYNAATFSIGQQYLEIPPGRANVRHDGVCTPQCTKAILKGPVHVTTALNHMHYLGVRQNVTLHRAGMNTRTLTDDNPYSYDSPHLYLYKDPVTLLPGDELRTACTFSSRSLAKTTVFGLGSYDEMCYSFLTVYPKENLTSLQCVQWKEVDFCQTDFISDCDFAALFNSSHPDTANMIKEVMDVCSPLRCREDCRPIVQRLMRENRCFAGGLYRFLEESFFTMEDAKLIKFISAIMACDDEDDMNDDDDDDYAIASTPRPTPSPVTATARPAQPDHTHAPASRVEPGNLFLKLVQGLDARPLLQNIIMNVNYNNNNYHDSSQH